MLLLCAVDYDPKSRTALLDINLERTALGSSFAMGWRRRSVNNFKVEVLRWPSGGGDCPAGVACYSHPLTVEAATIVQSRRMCWTWILDSAGNVECDENVPVDRVKRNKSDKNIFLKQKSKNK